MAKKYFLILLLMSLAFSGSIYGFEDKNLKTLEDKEMSQLETYTWEAKFKRSLANLITFPLEIPASIGFVSSEKGVAQGLSLGLVEGLGRAVLRLGCGLLEFITAPFEFPDDDREPLVEPEFVWQRRQPMK